jgi:hypothetical protein
MAVSTSGQRGAAILVGDDRGRRSAISMGGGSCGPRHQTSRGFLRLPVDACTRHQKLCKNCAGSYWLDNAERAFPPAESLVPRLIVHTALELYRSTAIFASTRRAWQSRLAGFADRWPRGTAHPRAASLAPPRRGPRLIPIGCSCSRTTSQQRRAMTWIIPEIW